MNPEMSIVPPGGGWRFMQRLPNGGFHTFVEPTQDKLFDAVLLFRTNSNLPTANLRDELARGVSAPAVTKLSDQRSLRERVTAWLANRQFGQPKFVTPEVANERAAICVSCPFNTVNYADECIECFNSTIRNLYAYRQGRSTPYDENLGACSICGWDNKTAVHLDESLLKNRVNHTEELQKAPSCWCSQLDKDTAKEVG